MENQNSVCFVSIISEVINIPGADNIEQVMIGGWSCVTKKGEYSVGDKVIIATTDAVIPLEMSDAIGVTSYLRKGQRVKTVRLRGVYSECLIVPITLIPDKYKSEGVDCMELLNIFKYEPPVKSIQLGSGKVIKYKDNPRFPVYYKFPNIKNVKKMFTEEDEVEISRKQHGTNSRYGIVKKTKITFWDKIKRFLKITDEWSEFEYIYGSHNVQKGSDSNGFYGEDVWMKMADKYELKKHLWYMAKYVYGKEKIGSGIVLYGEIYGPGIQKNYDYGLEEIEFAGFDITLDGKYLSTIDVNYLLDSNSIKQVPILYRGNWSQEIQDKFTFGNFIEGTKVPHEGIVVKATSGDRHKIAKVISPEYLIYGEKHNVGDSH